MRDMTCAEVDDSAPGYALGILDPGRRSSVASHIRRCGRCRENVSRTQRSADRLLDIGASPPSVVEADDRFGPEGPFDGPDAYDDTYLARRQKRPLRAAATMAAIVVLLVGTTIGPELEQAGRAAPVPTLAVPLMAAGNAIGSVRVFAGQPPVLQIEVTDLPGRQLVHANLVDADGRVDVLGQFRLSPGHTGWASSEPRDMPHPKSLILADAHGDVLGQAALS